MIINRNVIMFLMAILFCIVIFVNYSVLVPMDTHLQELENLRTQNDALNTRLREQEIKLKRYEDEKKKNELPKKTDPSVKLNSTAGRTQVDIDRESNFRKLLLDYFQLHKDIMSGKEPAKFAQCVLLNGWGNVLQEAISCFLFAFVTKRALIFNVSPIEKYMPFRDYLSWEEMPFDGYNTGILTDRPEVVVSRHELSCMDYEDLAAVEVITIHLTYDYWAPNILTNPNHGEELFDVLPPNYFQIIFGYLFKLKPDIQADVDKHKREHFGEYNIGIQIRHPTNDLKGAKDHKGFPVPPLDLYSEAAEQLTRFQTKVPYDKVVWFVATQNVDLIKHMQKYYGNTKVTSYNGTITTTFDAHSEGQRVSLITWWLLGDCDDVITTEASSYGTVAAARTGLFPVVCTHQKFCFRRLSQTPCQDTQFLVDQPSSCMMKERKYPHQYITSPENSCGYFKHQIYTSPEYVNAVNSL